MGYCILQYFATFMRFMQFSTNLIAGCNLASLWPPHLEHIWGPKIASCIYVIEIHKEPEISSKNPCDLRNYKSVPQLAVFDIDLGGPKASPVWGFWFYDFFLFFTKPH